MDLRYAEAFYHVAKLLNIHHASKIMHIAPSAVHRQISLFESSVGISLFSRAGKKISLTNHGLEYLRLLQPLFSHSQQSAIRRLVFGGVPISIEEWLLPKLAPLVMNKKIKLKCLFLSYDDCYQGLIQNQIDFALTSKKIEHDLIQSKVVSNDSLMFVCQKKFKFKKSSRSHETEQEIVSQIKYYSDSGEALRRYLEITKEDFENSNSIQINSTSSILNLIQKSGGISVIPTLQDYQNYKDLYFEKIPNSERKIYLSYLQTNQPPDSFKLIFDTLKI